MAKQSKKPADVYHMAAGVADHPLSLTQLVEILEEWERRTALADGQTAD